MVYGSLNSAMSNRINASELSKIKNEDVVNSINKIAELNKINNDLTSELKMQIIAIQSINSVKKDRKWNMKIERNSQTRLIDNVVITETGGF